MLVAKQAAVIDRLSAGRLTLGVSLSSRPDDYEVLGATLEHRVTHFRRQIATLRRVWAETRQSDREHQREFAEAVAHHQRYYPVLPVPAEQAIHHGPIEQIKDVVVEYAACGLDLLVLMPEVRSLRQLELLSEHILPEYRH